MKLQKLFIAILFIGTLFSCSNDDSDTNANLVGTWTLVDVNYRQEEANQAGTIITEGVGLNYEGAVTFTENPNEYTSDITFDMHVTSTMDGNVVLDTVYNNNTAVGYNGTWSLNGDQFSTTEDGANGITSNYTISFSDNGNTLTMVGLSNYINLNATYHRQ